MSASSARKFRAESAAFAKRKERRSYLRNSLTGYFANRRAAEKRFNDWAASRSAASAVKGEAIDYLDRYLAELTVNLEKRGTRIFFARNADRAREYIADVIREHEAKCIVKAKSMTGEEIHLTEFLEEAGYEVVETDLGEFIVKLRGERPFHIVGPAVHLKRGEIRDLFAEKIGPEAGKADDPESLAMDARRVIRHKYLEADIGISGVNFAVAETGQICLCTNEGNGRLTTSLPRVHIALMGLEKVIPSLDDLALLLPMLATAASGQNLTTYTNLIGGPRQSDESDGPEELHLVILDNGRTSILADAEQRDALHCIRCGACVYACPIFRNIGGHSYNTPYMGPIGSVITPHLRGLQEWKHLSQSSSLCGACTEACPVGIDLHRHLLHNRRNAAAGKPVWWEKAAFSLFRKIAERPAWFGLAGEFARFAQGILAPLLESRLSPVKAWTRCRALPEPPKKSFREWWEEHR